MLRLVFMSIYVLMGRFLTLPQGQPCSGSVWEYEPEEGRGSLYRPCSVLITEYGVSLFSIREHQWRWLKHSDFLPALPFQPSVLTPLTEALSVSLSQGTGLIGRVGNGRLFIAWASYPTALALTSIIITYS